MPVLDTVLSVLAPHNCLICGQEGRIICRWCEPDALPYLPSRCYRCHALTREFAVCDRCRRHSPLKQVWIRTAYEDVAKELIHGFKYEHQRAGLLPLAESLQDMLPYLAQDSVLVAVPTATARRRQRGYDHARLIARQLAMASGLMYAQPLARLSQSRQVGAGRQRRFEQLKGAFRVTRPQLIRDKRVILVDDIVTTGATIETAASLLKIAGAKRVDAIVFAQKR